MYGEKKVIWPGWETVQLIGRGGFGTVYEIQRKFVDDEVESAALKVITIPQNPSDIDELYSEGYDSESITASFEAHLKNIIAEYSLMQKMDGSANVVNCKDIRYVRHDDGIGWDIFIRMELLTPLLKALPAVVTEDLVIGIGKDICNALVLCKKYGIVHRDIKPQNIFISPNGDYKLGDFGIAKTVEKTMGGTKIGTYKYMAPEVYNNQPYGSSADIYSLGLVLYWLLNERRMPLLPLPPTKISIGQEDEARQRRLLGEPLPCPAHGSEKLKQIVLKACAFNPEERYASASEMLSDLNRIGQNDAEVKAEPVLPQDFTTASDSCDIEEDRTVGMFGSTAPNVAAIPDIQPDEDATVGLFFQDHSVNKLPQTVPTIEEQDRTVGAYTVQVPPNQMRPEASAPERIQTPEIPTMNEGVTPKPNKTRSVFILIVGVVLAVIIAMILLRSCNPKVEIENGTQTIELRSISIASNPDRDLYYVGETLNTSGLTLCTYFSDGRTEMITSGFSCSPTKLVVPGPQLVTVSYEGKVATFTVNVADISISSISIVRSADKLSYFVGESLNTSGLTLEVIYSDGSTKMITDGFDCSPSILNVPGVQPIDVNYGGITATFTVDVSAIDVSGITIQSTPTKMSYYIGDTLNTSGLTLKVTYNNGTTQTVTNGFTCSPTTLSASGSQKITVTYSGKTTTFTVNVVEVSVDSISIRTMPSDTSYYVGESLDMSGLTLNVVFNNGTTTTVNSGFSYHPVSLTSAGSQSIIVTYGDQITSFSVSVNNPTITLSTYSETKTMDCWDSYWNASRGVPLWKIYLPDVSTTPGGDAVSWSIVSGRAYIAGDYIAAQQPGTITARATFTYCGYSYSADYTVQLSIYKKPTALNYLMKGPARDTGVLDNVPAGVTVYITEIAWDAAVQQKDGQYYLWGKITYNGKTGWIVIS